MDCSCISLIPNDGPEFSKHTTPKARKEHKCCECHRTIKIGETYEKEFGIWNGDPHTFKTCEDCMSLRNAFMCDGWVFEELRDTIEEFIYHSEGDVSSDCILSLTPAARNYILNYIDSVWANQDEQPNDNLNRTRDKQ